MTGFFKRAAGPVASTIAAASLFLASPAMADSSGQAEKLRRLDIMLMVTGLRCRTSGADFLTDFADFEAVHMADLNGAAAELRGGLLAAYGKVGADRALDRLSTIIANQYGSGHPWMNCGELKSATRLLAVTPGRDALLAAADQMLGDGGGVHLALAQH